MTLIEMLNVLILLGILLSIATPSYLGLKDRTYKSAARANIRNALPAVIEYGVDNTPNSTADPDGNPANEGYDGLSESLLKSRYDPTLDTTTFVAEANSSSGFCIYSWSGPWTAYQAGPGQAIGVTENTSFDSHPNVCH